MNANVTLRDTFLRPFNAIDRINNYQQLVNNNLEKDLNTLNGKKATILSGSVITPDQQKEVKSLESQIKNVRGHALIESLQLSFKSRLVATVGFFGFNTHNALSSFGKIIGRTPSAVALAVPQLIDLARKKTIPVKDTNLAKVAILALKTLGYVLFAAISPLIGLVSPQGASKLQALFKMELNKEDKNALIQLDNFSKIAKTHITDNFNGNPDKKICGFAEMLEVIKAAKNKNETKQPLKLLELKVTLVSTLHSAAINNVSKTKECSSASVVKKAEETLNYVQTIKTIYSNHLNEAKLLVEAKVRTENDLSNRTKRLHNTADLLFTGACLVAGAAGVAYSNIYDISRGELNIFIGGMFLIGFGGIIERMFRKNTSATDKTI